MNLGVLKSLNFASKHLKDSVISHGSKSDSLHIVLRGEVGLFINYKKLGHALLAKLGPGEFFGEEALFLEQSTPYTAAALTDVITITVSKRSVADFISEEPGLTFELLKAVCERSSAIDAQLRNYAGAPWRELQTQPDKPDTRRVMPQRAPSSEAAAATEASAAETQPAPPPESIEFPLFPEGHGTYELQMDNSDMVHLMAKSYVCPVCKNNFKALRVKPSQLTITHADKDMRNHYSGVEPLYYDVTTCPFCLYSALTDMFQKPEKPNASPPPELKALPAEVGGLFSGPRTSVSVFAGYYLALLCAPVYFMKHESATANLYLKLSRVYSDCNDRNMELEITQKALDAYLEVYQALDLTPPQEQQLCVIMAELYLGLGDFKNAKNYFFRAKTTEPATPRLTEHAEMRLHDIQGIEKEAAQEATPSKKGKK